MGVETCNVQRQVSMGGGIAVDTRIPGKMISPSVCPLRPLSRPVEPVGQEWGGSGVGGGTETPELPLGLCDSGGWASSWKGWFSFCC